MMEDVVRALGKKNVGVFTSVPGDHETDQRLAPARIFRRMPGALGRAQSARLSMALSIMPTLLKVRPTVLQAATGFDSPVTLSLSRALRIPFVVYAHGNEIFDIFEGEWEKPKVAFRQANIVVANSNFTAKILQDYGVRLEKIRVVHPACDVQLFKPVARDERLYQKWVGAGGRGPVLLTVGNIVKRKGHDTVLRSISKLKSAMPGIVYLVVGDGRDREYVETTASEMGVREYVRFVGNVPDEQLASFYALADIFIMVSRPLNGGRDVEGFGKVYLEAGACGLAVIGGRSGGVPDAIVDGETGLLVDPLDDVSVAEAVATLEHDAALRQRFGTNGRERVLSEFTIDDFGKKIDSLLHEAVAQR